MDIGFFLAAGLLGGVIAGFLLAFLVMKGQVSKSYNSGYSAAGEENITLKERISGFEQRLSGITAERERLAGELSAVSEEKKPGRISVKCGSGKKQRAS